MYCLAEARLYEEAESKEINFAAEKQKSELTIVSALGIVKPSTWSVINDFGGQVKHILMAISRTMRQMLQFFYVKKFSKA